MKPPIAKLKPELEKETRAAIEQFAEVELKPDVVRLRIYEAARKGQSALRLRLPDTTAVDMRNTKGAALLAEWCGDNNLALTWESRNADLPDGRRVTIYEPEITWSVL